MAGLIEASIYLDGRYNCPCFQGSLQNSTVLSFFGNEYFYESGNPDPNGKASVNCMQIIFSGMVKDVVLMKKIVVKFVVSHSSTRSLTLLLLTILR